MSLLVKLWGYRADGNARVFLVPVGGKLPAGWSEDINVITDPALRDGTLLSEKAGKTINEPELVFVESEEGISYLEYSEKYIKPTLEEPKKEHWKTRQKREREEAAALADKPLRYDENLQQVID